MISFINTTKKFGNLVVVDGVSLDIETKEFVFIVGRSGCGKTTLFRLLNREFLPTAGEIELDGVKMSALPTFRLWQHRRKIGLIFQDMKLLFDRTVFENVALALEIRGEKKGEIVKKTNEIIDLVGLSGKGNLFPRELSGGEVQRTAIGRAIIGNPDLILADEPTADLDVATGWEIIQILQMLNRTGKTVIMATHNIDIVNSMKERVILLDKGRVLKDVKGEKVKI